MHGNRIKNFDELAARFQKNIYASAKGQIRLAVLKRDFAEAVQPHLRAPSQVLDAGGGIGHFALLLAQQGHEISLCDISADMLSLARAEFASQAPDANVHFIHSPLQELARHVSQPFDLVLCHAVLEWLADPLPSLQQLLDHLKPGGYLSLAFYNKHSIVYRNLIRGNLRKVKSAEFGGDPGSLTPTHPLEPQQVLSALQEWGFDVLAHTGMRVFYDHMPKAAKEKIPMQDVMELELQFSREEPYRSLARYVHLVVQKPV